MDNAKYILYNLVYVATMYRWGSREGHSYLVGVFQDLEQAKKAAEEERDNRGNKYEWVVQASCLNKDADSSYADCKMKIVARSTEMDIFTDDEPRPEINDEEKIREWYKRHGNVNAKEELSKLETDIECAADKLSWLQTRKEVLNKRLK